MTEEHPKYEIGHPPEMLNLKELAEIRKREASDGKLRYSDVVKAATLMQCFADRYLLIREVDRLTAENERLRGALTLIAEAGDPGFEVSDAVWYQGLCDIRGAARDALNPEGKP